MKESDRKKIKDKRQIFIHSKNTKGVKNMRKRVTMNFASVLMGVFLVLIIQEAKCEFAPGDPKANDPGYVNEQLDACISGGKREDAKKIARYAAERAGRYGLLIMVEFNNELTLEKIQQMKDKSPERWKMFNKYFSKAIKWTDISLKANKFVGKDLGQKIKKELGEK